METTENNKLIAEFMGVKFKDDEQYIKDLKEMKAEGIYYEQGYMASDLNYNSSWDWLMLVVEKINETHEVLIGRISINISEILDRDNPIVSIVCGNVSKKQEITYEAVVQFIKWYNEK